MKTAFFAFGISLTAFALIVSFVGLRLKKLPAGPIFGLTVLLFVILVAGTATFAVGYAHDEQAARRAEGAKQVVKGPGGTVQLSASPTDLAFDTTKLTSKPGKVTIDFTNPSTTGHNVAIVQGNTTLATTPTIMSSKASVSATLAPGTYTFLCTVPGHAEAGMQGTLVVK